MATAAVGIWLGTLIFYLPTPHGLYVSADSRHDGGDPALRDQARKIFLCGPQSVCAISGALRLDATTTDADGTESRGELDVVGTLERLSAELAADASLAAEQRVSRIGAGLHREIARFWTRHIEGRRVPAPLSARLGAPAVCVVLIATGGEQPMLTQVQFPFAQQPLEDGTWLHTLRPPRVIHANPANPLAQGRSDCPRVDPSQPPAVATREETLTTLASLYERAQQSPDGSCAAVIGGPVDIAVMAGDGGGKAVWLRRKGVDGY